MPVDARARAKRTLCQSLPSQVERSTSSSRTLPVELCSRRRGKRDINRTLLTIVLVAIDRKQGITMAHCHCRCPFDQLVIIAHAEQLLAEFDYLPTIAFGWLSGTDKRREEKSVTVFVLQRDVLGWGFLCLFHFILLTNFFYLSPHSLLQLLHSPPFLTASEYLVQ